MVNVGILTYAMVANFGANLQAYSTYNYLLKKGYNPILIRWEPKDYAEKMRKSDNIQVKEHYRFVENSLKQTVSCFSDAELNKVIMQYEIQAIVVGSDAVMQDFPFWARFHFPTKTIWRIDDITPERLFPNAFWGSFKTSLEREIPMVIMSASSQNTKYYYIKGAKKKSMHNALSAFRYISVRDKWTQDMVKYLSDGALCPLITPDPVFAFNYNCGEFVPNKQEIIDRFRLSEKYILFSFKTNILDIKWLEQFKRIALDNGYITVALPMPEGVKFVHPFDYEIASPLSPLDWYALIKYSSGYIGQNMHPAIVALHNRVPLYIYDSYGIRSLFGFYINEKSSKIYDIMNVFNLNSNRCSIKRYFNPLPPHEVFNKIKDFDSLACGKIADQMFANYSSMMKSIEDILLKK